MKIFKKNKSKVIILGADGMLGNAIYKYLKNNNIDVIGTSRRTDSIYKFFDAELVNIDNISNLFEEFKPSYVINCIGYIRPKNEDQEELNKSIIINSVLPQRFSAACKKYNSRFIHFSTDCVFDGKNGPYSDLDIPNEISVYGISKFLGEVKDLPNITIRTSIIGMELNSERNLLNWFLKTNEKSVNGYKNVFWNGVTTLTIAKIVKKIIDNDIYFDQPIIQISSETLSKYDLLCIFKDVFNKDIVIDSFEDIKSNKTLIPSYAQEKYFKKIIIPLREQIIELKEFYDT